MPQINNPTSQSKSNQENDLRLIEFVDNCFLTKIAIS